MSALDDVLAGLGPVAPRTILTRPAAPDTQAAPVYKRPAAELFARPAPAPPAPTLKGPAKPVIFAADELKIGDGPAPVIVWPSGWARLDAVPVNEAAPNAYGDERRRGTALRTATAWLKAGAKNDGAGNLPRLKTSFPYRDAGKDRPFGEALAELGKVIARTDRETYNTADGAVTATGRYAGRRLFPGWRIVATNGHVAQVAMCEDRADDPKPLQADPHFVAVGWLLGDAWRQYAHVRGALPDTGPAWVRLTWTLGTGGATWAGRPDRDTFDTLTWAVEDAELGLTARTWATAELHPDVAGPGSIRIDDKYLWPFRGTFVTLWAAKGSATAAGEYRMIMLTDGQAGIVIMGAKS